ncbi:MAG: MarR family transcriptional regulator [Polyangiaceae bacterium]
MSSTPQLPPDWQALSEPVRVFRLVLLAAQQLRYLMDRRLADAGLTTQQAMLLTVLDVLGGSATLSAAADKLSMTHQNVKQLAGSLESKGFVSLEVDENDRRARRLRPTPHSRRFWKQRGNGDHQAIDALMGDFSASELETLTRLLAKLTHAAAPVCRELRDGKG